MPPYQLLNPHFSNELLFKRLLSRQIRSSSANHNVTTSATINGGEMEFVPGIEFHMPTELARKLAVANSTSNGGESYSRGQDETVNDFASTISSVINSTVKSLSKGTKVESMKESSSFFDDVEKPMENMMKTVAKKTSIPFWAVFLIFLVIMGILALVFFCCLQRWWRKFRGKEAKGGFMGGKVDLKSVQLLGQTYKEKVQPEMEELTKDMEQNEAGKDEGKEDVKLG
ncbi:hypothetical protein BLA29_006244, partial [Euroglyphus maynei]